MMFLGPDRKSGRFAMVAIAAVALAVSALASSGTARAHAALVSAEPADGAVVAAKPAAFVLTFNEPVSPLVLKLVAPGGVVTDLDRPAIDGAALRVPVPADMARGTYLLSWRVVSLDGHPVGGTLVFSLGAASARPAPVFGAEVNWPRRGAIWLAKVVLYASLFFGAGAAAYRAVIAPLTGRARTLALALASAGILAAAVSVGLQGLDALDAPFDGIFHAAIWEAVASTTYFTSATIAVLALLAAIAALALESSRVANLLAFSALAGVGLALAASGHASNATPQWIARPAVFVHAVAICFWAGALPPLGMALRADGEGATQALRRFSRAIPFAIAPLVLSGLVLAVIQLGSPAALLSTGYGRVLLGKAALLAALFGLAAWNRWSLTERAEADDRRAHRTLVRSIAWETILVVAILGVVALWRFTPPPRALVEAAAPSAQVHLHGEKATAHLTLTPGRVGAMTASVNIMAEGSAPMEASEVTLVFTNPGSGLEAISRPAHKTGDGSWQAESLVLPLPGAWSARVEILVGDFEKIRLEGSIEIGP